MMNLGPTYIPLSMRITIATETGLSRLAVMSLLLVSSTAGFADSLQWSQFRGPNGAGVAEEQPGVPTTFGNDENLSWKLALPSGGSSPCVRGDLIFVTGHVKADKKLEVYCIDRNSGSISWRRTVPADRIERTHASSNPANGTPAADDERVYFYFGSYGLICYDHSGNQLWSVEQPIPQTRNGSGTSPIISGDLVLLNREEKNDSYLLAVQRETGETAWKHEHVFPPGMFFEGYSTPIIWDNRAILHTHAGIRAVDTSTGELAWQVDASSTGVSTPVIGGDQLYVATWTNLGEPDLRPEYPTFEALLAHDADANGTIGYDEFPRDVMLFHRPEARDEKGVALPMRFVLGMFDPNRDKQLTQDEWEAGLKRLADRITEHGLLAIKLEGDDRVASENVRVLEKRAIPEVPSPLYHDGRVYLIKRGGILSCYQAETGTRLYRKRLSATGSYYASPIAVGQRVFLTSAKGQVTVIEAADSFKLLAVNDLGERTLATPAIADGKIYVRTVDHLYAFGQ